MNNDASKPADNGHEATKRLARQGQWKTPDLPVFAAGGIVRPPAAAASSLPADSAIPLPATLPATPDEYARMLQEAYKRGAEAAARAQKCGEEEGNTAAVTYGHPTTNNSSAPPISVQYPAPSHPPHGQYAQHPTAPQISTHPPSTVQPKTATSMYASAANNYNFPTPSSAAPAAHYARPQPPQTTHMRPVHQSVSMPDISSYHHQEASANDEEEKRKKRLARNRASARLRRLKKKNLVDSYEGEVGILEAALTKLRSHKWSPDDDNHEALIEALSMERGQQPLTPESRKELIQSIVTQQKEQVTNLLDCQMENWMLSCLADTILSSSDGGDQNSASGANNTAQDEEMNELTNELQSILQLTPDQLTRIQQSSHGITREIQDLNTVDQCLDSILSNQWLLDEGVDEVASQFTSILNPSQMSKFLLWTDHNADAIDKLDYVNVGVGLENAPVFEFGVDEGMDGGD